MKSTPPDHMSPWSTIQRSGYSGIRSLFSPSPSRPLFRAPAVLLSICCIGKQDSPVSELSFHHTTSNGQLLSVWSIAGILLWVHVRALDFRTWLPMTSQMSLGWVSCCRPCLSVSNCSACCTYRPSTMPSPSIVTLITVWLCTRPWCILACVLCILGLSKYKSKWL